ncbi:MAG: hypothetical protein C0498_01320 [Anaerolinea sp.]|nr:hypothetical protein [Anaerolinea sp.]
MLTLGSGAISAAPWYAGGQVQPPTGVVLAQASTGGALSNGTYVVQVTAYNAAGESTPTAEQTIVLNGGTATQRITVTFTAPASGPAPTGYRIYIGTVSGFATAQGTTAASPYNQTGALSTAGAQARFVGLVTIGEIGGDAEFDITYQDKDFYGQSLFPVARAFYGGKATVRAKKVELRLEVIEHLLAAAQFSQSGTLGSGTDVYAVGSSVGPAFLYVVFTHQRSDATGKTVVVEAFKASCKQLAFPFSREDISTRDLEFDLIVDTSLSNSLLTVKATQ